MRKTKPIPTLTPEQIARFWANVNRRGPNECWEWRGASDERGYGRVQFRPHGLFLPHRVAFAMDRTASWDLLTLHRCDNPRCCNPSHLFLGTQQDSMTDMCKKGRHKSPIIPKVPRGDDHYNAKLTSVAVVALRKLKEPGKDDLLRIGQEYRVSQITIQDALKSRTWKHITGTP